MSDLGDENLVGDFIAECQEHLSVIEPDLLVLEREGAQADQELINRIFRSVHSIKGTASFFEFDTVTQLSHVMESVLMQVRERCLVPSSEVVESLLGGIDKLRLMIEDVSASHLVSCHEEIQQFERILAGQSPSIPKTGSSSAGAGQTGFDSLLSMLFIGPEDYSAIKSAGARGRKLYALRIDAAQDLRATDRTLAIFLESAEATGLVVKTSFNKDAPPDIADCTEQAFFILYATILEPELVAVSLDVPEERITLLPKQELLAHLSTMESPVVEALAQPAKNDVVASQPDALFPDEASRKPEMILSEGSETVRVRVEVLNRLMDLAGEMVLSRNQLLRVVQASRSPNSSLSTITQNIDWITTDLQEQIMQTRMQPIGNALAKFPRVVRDTARQLGKQIDLHMSGGEVELDKSILESLSAPLTHLIRNACDHGIELPDEREKLGKPGVGSLSIQVFQEGGQINIVIADDGRGMDGQRIAQKAIEKGLVKEADINTMSAQDKVNLIFLPGFSTAETISDLSGRGVGMDVVKTNIEKLGGHIVIDSVVGQGTTFMLRLPLTMAIIPSLIVGVTGLRFAVPQINLVELVCVKAADVPQRIQKVGSANVFYHRGDLLPLVHLSELFQLERFYRDPASGEMRPDRRLEVADVRPQEQPKDLGEDAPEELPESRRKSWRSNYMILVVKVGLQQFGLIVDRLFDLEEIVVKPLPSFLQHYKCYAGVTILGDGEVALILDPAGIFDLAKLAHVETGKTEKQQPSVQETRENTGERQTCILFHSAPEETFAIPLASVSRLEKLDPERVEQVGQRSFLSYQDKALPLVHLADYLDVRPLPENLKRVFLIITQGKRDHEAVGILASKILDIVELGVELQEPVIQQPGILGSAIVNGKLAVFLEPQALLGAAETQAGKG